MIGKSVLTLEVSGTVGCQQTASFLFLPMGVECLTLSFILCVLFLLAQLIDTQDKLLWLNGLTCFCLHPLCFFPLQTTKI